MYTKYPQFGVHKKQHDEFLERLTSFKKDVGKKADSALGKELLDYCISWLTNHIRVVDKLMISCCIPPEELKNNNMFINTPCP